MKKTYVTAALFLFMTMMSTTAFADGGCRKCQLIRNDNAKKTNPYPYYEDYLKAQGKDGGQKQDRNQNQQNDNDDNDNDNDNDAQDNNNNNNR